MVSARGGGCGVGGQRGGETTAPGGALGETQGRGTEDGESGGEGELKGLKCSLLERVARLFCLSCSPLMNSATQVILVVDCMP